MAIMIAAPARAQLAASLSIDNDYRLRGYSIGAKRPVATLDLSYDHDSGVYFNAAATAVLTEDDHVALLAVNGSIGYARRVGSNVSFDAGVARSEYRSGFYWDRGAHFTEFYLGVTSARLSSHVYYSPDYLHAGVSTVYGEVDAVMASVGGVKINGHLGLLGTLSVPSGVPPRRAQYDWRVGASRQFGAVDVHAALTGGGPGVDYYEGRAHSKTAVTFGAGWFF